MTDRKYVKQHFVSQGYLKRFSEQNKNNDGYHICVYQKGFAKRNVFIQNIDNIAYIKNYYDVDTRDEAKYWEHFFANNIEPGYVWGIDSIISRSIMTKDGSKVFDLHTKKILSELMVFQYMRVPVFLENRIHEGMNNGKELYTKISDIYGDRIPEKQYETISKYLLNRNGIKDLVIESMTDEGRLNKYADVLCAKKWVIVKNESSIPFITSDMPVIFYNLTSKSCRFGNGILFNDTVIYYPLSSRYLIQLYSWNLDLGKGEDHAVVNDDDLKYVLNVNQLQYINANKQIYFTPSFQSIFESFLDEVYLK